MDTQILFAPGAPKAVGTYSHGTIFNGVLYTAGQIALDPDTNEMISGDITEEATRVMKNLGWILEAAGTNFDRLLKATIYLTDLNDFTAVDNVYKSFVNKNWPARTCIEVSRIPKGGRVEIEMIVML